MGAEATCARLDVTSNGIGRGDAVLRCAGTSSAVRRGMHSQSSGCFTYAVSAISREGGEASAETSEATCEIIVASASNLQVSAGNYDFPPCDPS